MTLRAASLAMVGGTLVIMPAFSANGLVELVERHGVTHGGFVPLQFRRLLELPDLEQRRLGSLQAIMCCGSPLAPDLKRATRDRLGCELIELYGLTEGIITTLAPEDFDDEGFLYIVDRKKDMILTGGQNVYPADIEQVMHAHPDVADVAVVVPQPGVAADPAALVAWTNERVGRQQRVSRVVLRDSLPRNPNGKILKRELRAEYVRT